MDLNDDLSDYRETEVPWKLIVLSLAGLQIHLLLGGVFGLNTFQLGKGVAFPLSFLIHGVFLIFMVHTILVWPITSLAFPSIEKVKSEKIQWLVLVLLLTPPLLSFSYYLGKFKDRFDYLEMVMVVLPVVSLGAALFLKTKKAGILTAVILLGSGFSWFICNEILAPWDTVFRVVSTGQAYLWIRVLCPTVVTLASIYYLRLTTVKA
jgi:hypothetical protein